MARSFDSIFGFYIEFSSMLEPFFFKFLSNINSSPINKDNCQTSNFSGRKNLANTVGINPTFYL